MPPESFDDVRDVRITKDAPSFAKHIVEERKLAEWIERRRPTRHASMSIGFLPFLQVGFWTIGA